MNNFSQTQLQNLRVAAGVIVMIAAKFNFALDLSETLFILGGLWTIGTVIYSYYQRFKKGDLSLGGRRLNI